MSSGGFVPPGGAPGGFVPPGGVVPPGGASGGFVPPGGFAATEGATLDPAIASYRAGVRTLGHVALGLGVLMLAFSLMILGVGVLGGLGLINPHDTAADRFGGMMGSFIVGGLWIIAGSVNVVAGIGLRRLAPWGRTLGIVAAFVSFLGGCGCLFTLGFAIWALVVLFDARAPAAFR